MATVRQVKVAQKKAGIQDAEYRQLLRTVAGVDSCTALDDDGRERVLHAIQQRSKRNEPLVRKLWALFYAMRAQLAQDDIARPRQWLLGVARKANDDDTLASLDALSRPQLMKAVEALKARTRQRRRRTALVAPVNYSRDDL